ncbi:MAG: hypothetical protein AB8F95_10395 [Bacteroidia bacterium]
MSEQILFITKTSEEEDRAELPDLHWRLERYIRTEQSEIRRAIRKMSYDIGFGIDLDQIKAEINAVNCFDFEPVENDRLTINNGKTGADYKFFSLLFRNGLWIKGDYYSTKIPAKGIIVITKTMAEGRLKRSGHNSVK